MSASEHNVSGYKIAVVLPCFNEVGTIGLVVSAFQQALPASQIYVFDNNSDDGSGEVAKNAGAKVIEVSSRGKGNVVRRMFADVDADIYIMADSDLTYEASDALRMIEMLIDKNLDMVVGSRISGQTEHAYRRGHKFGNALLSWSARVIFGGNLTDMLSGYRVFSKRFAKSFPAFSQGFEIETELTIHALELRMPIAEYPTKYRARPPGSVSKLSTYKDGFRVASTIAKLFMIEHPLAFYTLSAFTLFSAGIYLSIPIFSEYFETGLVPRIPTTILIIGIMLSGLGSLFCGIVLDTVSRGRHEIRRIAYLAVEVSPKKKPL